MVSEHSKPDCSESPAKKARMSGSVETNGVQHIFWQSPGAAEVWSWPTRLDSIAESYGDVIGATDDTGAEMTWAQLAATSRVVAKALRRHGLTGTPSSAYPHYASEVVEAPPPLVLMMGHNVQALAIIFGALRQGFPLLPLSVLHGDKKQLRQRYGEAMALFNPAAIVSDSPLAQELLTYRPGVQVIRPQDLLIDGDPSEQYGQDVQTTLDSALAYMFTSGSSGQSKCVVATNRMSWAEVQWYPELFRSMGVKIDPRTDRWRQDHEMGWWGAAYFGEIGVALAMSVCIVMMKSNDPDISGRGVTMLGALPSQLQNLWPGAKNRPATLRVILSWAERCDVELGDAWKRAGVKMADLLIATEFWLSLASSNLEVARGEDGRAAHAMRPVGGAVVSVLSEDMELLNAELGCEVKGMLGISGPQVTPGYAELDQAGRTVIGAGPLSTDTFKIVNGQWTVVPKDLVKRCSNQSLLSIGRAGGTVKVSGGVLMATNVVEQDLQQKERSIAAACITDPARVGGGSSLVLEIDWQDAWSLRDCLKQVGFLRMPTLFMISIPRNQSTGKVQKALVQESLESDFQAEMCAKAELRLTQQAQLQWYKSLTLPVLILCAVQPVKLFELLATVEGTVPAALAVLVKLLGLGTEVILRFCSIAWAYGSTAHMSNLVQTGGSSTGVSRCFIPFAAVAAYLFRGDSLGVSLACVCMLAILGWNVLDKQAKDSDGQGRLCQLQQKVGRLAFAMIIGLIPRLCNYGPTYASMLVYFGLLSIFSSNRCLPPTLPTQMVTSTLMQRIAAASWALGESAGYMLGFPVVFALALPKIMLSQFPVFSWARQKRYGRQIDKNQGWTGGWPYAGPWNQVSRVQVQADSKGVLWVDVDQQKWQIPETSEAPMSEDAMAKTPAGVKAKALARKAGVDFSSVDSLKIMRLSVMLKKHLRRKPEAAPLEFLELREACDSVSSFVELIDDRLMVPEENEHSATTSSGRSILSVETFRHTLSKAVSWVQGGVVVHREGATQAPWDCAVDMLLEWRGDTPLDQQCLDGAVADVLQQHPMLRARAPPDDSTDLLMGDGSNGLSSVASATWILLTTVWAEHRSWVWRISEALRKCVAAALWRCWPRTLVVEQRHGSVRMISQDSEGWASNLADEVLHVLRSQWDSWASAQSMLNVCAVTLNTTSGPRQFVYLRTSHKYNDGGGGAALVHALVENYDARVARAGAPPEMIVETPVLQVQQERLQTYLRGNPCPQGSIDCYFMDVNHDSFYHPTGYSSGVVFTESVCDLVRAAGLKMGCSEEIAWIACMVCALSRLLPKEKLLKIMIVHNGRLGDAEGLVACTSQYVLLNIPVACDRANIPIADVAARVKYAVSNEKFTRPEPCEQTHAKINIGGMVGTDGAFSQAFITARPRPGGRSKAQHVLQLRMDCEKGTSGPLWIVKDFKMHELLDAKVFWQASLCSALEIAEGWFVNPLEPAEQ